MILHDISSLESISIFDSACIALIEQNTISTSLSCQVNVYFTVRTKVRGQQAATHINMLVRQAIIVYYRECIKEHERIEK